MGVSLVNISRNKGDPRILSTGPSSLTSADRTARSLGWLSIGLGVTELLAPGLLARQTGLYGRKRTLRLFGMRELLSGFLTLSVDKQAGLWARVAGDALDLLTLAPALSRQNPRRGRATVAFLLLAGVTVADMLAAQAVGAEHAQRRGTRRSYRERSGFPHGVQAARQIAGKSRDRLAAKA